MKKKRALTILCVLALAACALAFGWRPHPAAQTSPPQQAAEVPAHVMYKHLFHHVIALRKKAEEVEKESKDATFSVGAGIQAQPQTQPEENRYVVVPPDVVFLLIASQPGFPIGFKDMKLLMRIDNKRSALSGKIYNAGTKPIR